MIAPIFNDDIWISEELDHIRLNVFTVLLYICYFQIRAR